MARAETFLEGLHFGEGPRWHEGRLWYSDFYDHAVFAVDMDGRRECIVELTGQPSGLGWLPDGRLLIVSMLDRKLLRLDGGELVEHADLSGVATFHTNDMVVDSVGRAYVGNFGFDLEAFAADRAAGGESISPTAAALARVDADGTVTVAAHGLEFPNGTVITPDGSTLIIAESFGRRLSAFDVGADGTLSNQRVWADLGRCAPDGICLDADGCVWVANAVAPECIRVAEGGEIVDRIETEAPTFACMLGGPDRTTLFILTAPTSTPDEVRQQRNGRILAATVATPGAGWP
jgi:sugar lactone lactonase YvrE